MDDPEGASRGCGSMASGRRERGGVWARRAGGGLCGWCFIDGYMYTYYFRFSGHAGGGNLSISLSFSHPSGWRWGKYWACLSGRSVASLAGRLCAATERVDEKSFPTTPA